MHASRSIATIGCNKYNWGFGGAIVVEQALFTSWGGLGSVKRASRRSIDDYNYKTQ
jgi:hypothetical protein